MRFELAVIVSYEDPVLYFVTYKNWNPFEKMSEKFFICIEC